MAFLALGLIITAALALAAGLLHLSRSRVADVDPAALEKWLSKPADYGSVIETLADENAEFFGPESEITPAIDPKVRRSRRKLLAFYLREMRRDFQQAWSVCRLFAPMSDDPNFGVTLMRHLVVFYAVYTLVWMRFLLSGSESIAAQAAALTRLARAVRESALVLVQTTQAQVSQA